MRAARIPIRRTVDKGTSTRLCARRGKFPAHPGGLECARYVAGSTGYIQRLRRQLQMALPRFVLRFVRGTLVFLTSLSGKWLQLTISIGLGSRDRTCALRIPSPALYHLSYTQLLSVSSSELRLCGGPLLLRRGRLGLLRLERKGELGSISRSAHEETLPVRQTEGCGWLIPKMKLGDPWYLHPRLDHFMALTRPFTIHYLSR